MPPSILHLIQASKEEEEATRLQRMACQETTTTKGGKHGGRDEDVVFVDGADSGLSQNKGSPTPMKTESQAMDDSPLSSADERGTAAHQCPHCPKAFERLEHLERHSRKHSGEKPYLCLLEGCDRGFSRYDNMIQHYHCHFDKGHRRKKRDLRETLKKTMMGQESGENRPLTAAENLTLRTMVQTSFIPNYPCPAPLPRGRKPTRGKVTKPSLFPSPSTSASQSPMSHSRSPTPSDESSPISSATSTPAFTSPSSETAATPQFSPIPVPFTPHLNFHIPPPPPSRMYSIQPRSQMDEAQLSLLKPSMF